MIAMKNPVRRFRLCIGVSIALHAILFLISPAADAQTAPPRLIVRGDDMGFCHAANVALIDCYKNGIEKSIEVIVPSPWFPEAVSLLKQYPGIDVGIHLALTSEWDNVKWRPISDCPSLKDGMGYFYPMVWPNKNYPGRAIKEHSPSMADIEKELRAQIELAKKMIPNITHFSAHMGCTDMNDSVKLLAHKLAKEYNIAIFPEDMGVINASYAGAHGTSAEKIASFINMLNSLQPGKTYLFVDHPGLNDAEMKAINHIGYEDVAADRQGVTDTWTNPEVMATIKKKGIVLISYNDLRGK